MAAQNNEQLGLTTRWVLIAVLVLVSGAALWLVKDIILLTFASVILTILIGTPIRFFIRRGMGRGPAVAISLALITALVILAFILVVPGLVEQFASLARLIPQAFEQLQHQLESGELYAQFPWLEPVLQELDIDLTTLGPVLEQLFGALQQIPTVVFPFVGGVASTLLSLLVVFFMTGYFLATPDVYLQGMITMVPIRYRPRAQEIVNAINLTMRGFLQAKILSMVLVGFGAFVGLSLLGIPLAPALGTLTGVFSFVPNFGPLVALIPTLAVTIVNAPEMWLWVIVVIYGLVFVESQLVGPWLMSEQIDLPPVLVLVGQIIAGIFFGFLGLLLSVPLTAMLMVLVREVYVKDILGDRDDETPSREDDELLPDGV